MYKEEFRTISGTYPDGRHHAIHITIDGITKCAELDMSQPVTLKRLHDVKSEHKIWEYDCDPDDKETISLINYGDIAGTKTVDKTYQFWANENRLLIWDHDTPIYENNNGAICKDVTALADSLC